MLPTTDPLYLANDQFLFARNSSVLRDITANGATSTDIFTREQTQKVIRDRFSTTNSSVLGRITTNGATETGSKTLQD